MAGNETKSDGIEPQVPTEHPDPNEAGRPPRDSEDRPGADLGGASQEGREGPNETIPGGPRSDPSIGKSQGGPDLGGSQASGPPDGTGAPRRGG